MVPLRRHVQREQHGAVDAAALRILHPKVHALFIRLDIVAELRLQGGRVSGTHVC